MTTKSSTPAAPELPLNGAPASPASPPAQPEFDEGASLKALQRDFAAVTKGLDTIRALKPADPDVLQKLGKALQGLPDGQRLASAFDELRGRGEEWVRLASETRIARFRRFEAEWVQSLKGAGTTIRETGANAWRTGLVEVEVQPDKALARAKYNREPVTEFRTIRSAADLAAMVAAAEEKLNSSRVEPGLLASAAEEAYRHLAASRSAGGAAPRIALNDFYRELRVCLTRQELAKKPDRRISGSEFPRWAFLFNLDVYRRRVADGELPSGLLFETGSQHDIQKGMSMTLNGLDARDDYRPYCYVYGAGPR